MSAFIVDSHISCLIYEIPFSKYYRLVYFFEDRFFFFNRCIFSLFHGTTFELS